MTNTLVDPQNLTDFLEGEVSSWQVDIAVAEVRAEAGWHIAPVRTETLTVDSYGGPLLLLPTRRLVGVTAIRNVTNGVETLTNWVRMSGGIYLRTGWPVGVLEVDLTHGYAETPLELLPVIAGRVRNMTSPRDPTVASRSVGSVTEQYREQGGASATVDPVIARYALPAGVA